MLDSQIVAIRAFDFIFALLGIILLMPLMIILYTLIAIDGGQPIFIQYRVGKNDKPFRLLKFRTMSLETESVASHKVDSSKVTRLGRFLRQRKLDELPQLINVLLGSMSLVGPRPCLYSQIDVIESRSLVGLIDYKPGITGLSQISGIDMSTPRLLAEVDEIMMKKFSIIKYFSILCATVFNKISGDAIYTRTKSESLER